MAGIKRVAMFETMGQRFPSVAEALEFREGLVERFLAAVPGFQDIPAKQRIPFVQHILDNRKTLIALLDYDCEGCDDDDE
jgi:hypothetical protein